jgi:hypothetical protein
MKLSQKRTCNRCRAFNMYTCDLHYRTEMSSGGNFLVPKEPCPKPLSFSKLVEYSQQLFWAKQL